jgi:hypothetical protein
LKGALLFDLWFDQALRPTTDIDLLGFGSAELAHLQQVFKDVCVCPCEDGIIFDANSVHAAEIRKAAGYAGVRITLQGQLDGARCSVQVDIGFGDAVTPAPESVRFPVLLDELPQPFLRVYPVYTVIGEKYHAIVSLGMANTRLKDYFDLWVLAQHGELDRAILVLAIQATFERRATCVPVAVPLGLTVAFSGDALKQKQWLAFLARNRLVAPSLSEVVAVLQKLLLFDDQ